MVRKNQEKNKVIQLEWDSHFFGLNIGRIYAKDISIMDLEKTQKQAKKSNIKFIELFCDNADHSSIYSAENYGFHLADVRMTLEKKLEENEGENSLPRSMIFKKALRQDIDELKKVSMGLFRSSRYYKYLNFDIDKVDQMFQIWIEKSVLGKIDDELYYIKNNTDIMTFCSLGYHRNVASIGLFGVNKAYRDQKLATLMLTKIFEFLRQRHFDKVILITQGRNSSALITYQKSGFVISSVTLCYYKWLA
jgi:dTDP-4-amino-4,6-dideoxy-D-galactose acyltransferase